MSVNGDMSSDDVEIVRYEWTIVTGDDGASLTDVDSAIATAVGLAVGQYTLKLTVYDSLGQMDEDEVNINVKGHYSCDLARCIVFMNSLDTLLCRRSMFCVLLNILSTYSS